MIDAHNKPETVDLSNPKWFEAAGIVNPMAKRSRPALEILADNLRRLIGYTKGGRSKIPQNFLAKKGVSQASIGRILRKDSAAGIDTVEKIATHFGLAVWQLLVDELDPDHPPVLRVPHGKEAEFYRRIREAAAELNIELPDLPEKGTGSAPSLLESFDGPDTKTDSLSAEAEERVKREDRERQARSVTRYGSSTVARTHADYGGTDEQQKRARALETKTRRARKNKARPP